MKTLGRVVQQLLQGGGQIFIGGQEIPKTGAGYYSYSLPLGPEGLLGIIGTAGLCVFLYVLITTVLPLDRLGAGNTPRAGA